MDASDLRALPNEKLEEEAGKVDVCWARVRGVPSWPVSRSAYK